jgi:hypothetical protein
MTDSSGASDAIAAERAVPTSVGSPSPEAAPGSAQDWTDQVTGLIVDSVDKVKSRTTGPILEVTRGSVHAVVALLLLTPVVVLLTILAIRVLTYFVFREVWITYTVLGMLFTLIGVVLWSRRHAGASRA